MNFRSWPPTAKGNDFSIGMSFEDGELVLTTPS